MSYRLIQAGLLLGIAPAGYCLLHAPLLVLGLAGNILVWRLRHTRITSTL
jgi:hypothetical protein